MNQDERLSGALQQNILTLICFDDRNCKIVRAAITPQLFESSVFREIAGHAIDFIDQYGVTIGEHLPDHLEDVLNGDDKRKATSYKRLVDDLFASRDSINSDYIVGQLHKFVRLQNLKSSLIRAVEAMEDGRIDAAEVEMQKGLNTQSVAFEAGLSLSNADDVASLMDDPEEEGFDLGIDELDRNGIKPRRKELMLFLAPRGRGKSWFITYATKQALLQRWSAVIVTLEMSEKRYAGRLLQSFFSISRRESQVRVTRLIQGRDGNLEDVVQEQITRMTLQDDNIKAKLISRAKREFQRRPKFRIKQFPSGTLTIAGLKAYLDGLERFEKFTPDLICIDYPDLMEIDNKNLRLELGKLIVDLRGIAVARNTAVIAVSQGNRDSETATTVTGAMAAEDISKLATADVVLTYSQTLPEKALGLARILVDKARNEEDKFSILITQAYSIGQFCLDSLRLGGKYWDFMKSRGDGPDNGRRRLKDTDD
jgi:replicative DNA helicase